MFIWFFFLLTKLPFGVYLVDRFRKHYEVVSYDEFRVIQEKKIGRLKSKSRFDAYFLSDGLETTPNPGPVEDDILISKMRPGH